MEGADQTPDFDKIRLFTQSDYEVMLLIETPCGVPDTFVLQDGTKRAFLGACDGGSAPSNFGCSDLDLCDLSLFSFTSRLDTTGLFDFVRNEIEITNIFEIDTSGLKGLISDCISIPPSGWECDELDNCNMTFLDPNSKVDSTGLKSLIQDCLEEQEYFNLITQFPTPHTDTLGIPFTSSFGAPNNARLFDMYDSKRIPDISFFNGAQPVNGAHSMWQPVQIAQIDGNPTSWRFEGSCSFYLKSTGINNNAITPVTSVMPGINKEASINECTCDFRWNGTTSEFEVFINTNIPTLSNPYVVIIGEWVFLY